MSNFYFDNKGLKTKGNNISAGSHPILSSGLVLYFDPHNPASFNPSGSSTIYDLSGYDNHGIIFGGGSITNNSLSLANKRITVPDHPSLRMSSAFTQFIWVRFNNEELGSFKVLFGKSNYWNYGLIVEWYGGNPILGDFNANNQRNGIGAYRYITNNVNVWSMVAHTYDSNATGYNHCIYYCYNNQIFILRSNSSGLVVENAANLNIGDPGLSMNIGKVGLYNRALDLSEIKKIYLKTKLVYGLPNELIRINRVGCTDAVSTNYDNEANINYGCFISGCTNPAAINYNPSATVDDGSCAYS